jgi:translation initiation factor 3 subunit L
MSKGDYYDEHHIHNDVKSFIKKLGKNLRAKDVDELQNLYEKEFMVLTDRFYKASKWPTPDSVSPSVDGDRNSLVLYKDLYYRHIYNKLESTVTVDDRFNSFHNYINFFNTLLGLTTSTPELVLPAVWLWDIIDEFIYQFRSFHTMRGSHRKSDGNTDELQLLKDHPHVWSAQTVIQYLHALVNKANKAPQGNVAPFFKYAAEFSLIGLCRVNVLLGDYYGALQSLDSLPLDMNKRPYYDCQGILACHTTLHYYLSFAYVMLNRFQDAISTITDGIIYINRNKQFLPRSYQDAIITKKTTCMLNLLAIAVSVNPQSLDDAVNTLMKEAIGEANLACMLSIEQSTSLQAFEQAFEHACPKFINPAIPDFDSIAHIEDEARSVQVRVFLAEIKERTALTELTNTLQLCNTVSTKKLATLAKKDDDGLVSDLLAFKIKNKQLKHKDAKPPVYGVWSHASPVNFFFKNDVITVSESVEVDRYAEYFMSQILKYEDFIDEARQVR